MNRPKKVILIVIDTLRAKNLGAYSSSPSDTPNIDSLAKQSVIFNNAFASITCTDPSITSIMSGRYPLAIGLVNHANKVTSEEIENVKKTRSLPQILKKNGYKTLAIDWMERWHKSGYDYYSGRVLSKNIDSRYPISERLPFPLYLRIIDKVSLKYLNREFFIRGYYALSSKPSIPYDPADTVIAHGIKLLSKNKSKKSFLYMHLWDAHAPHIRPTGLKSYLLDNMEDTYKAEVKFIDTQIGKLVEYLKKTNQFEETLIIITADHGESFNTHDVPFNHENLYNDVVNVPLIVSYGKYKSRRVASLVRHVDIFPTILEICGIKYPNKKIDGNSLVSSLEGKRAVTNKYVYFEDIVYRKIDLMKPLRRRGIFDGKYKYIQTIGGKKSELYKIFPREDLKITHEELFNLDKDKLEKKNIILAHRKIGLDLKSKLEEHVYELNMNRLEILNPLLYKKVQKAIKVIRQGIEKYKDKNIAIAWTGGKDSTVLLHLVRLACGGKIPFRAIFNDSTMEFEEIYKFIENIKHLWNIDLITIKHSAKELKEFYSTNDIERKKELSRIMKITAINSVLKKYKFKALIAGIRWDEHEARSKEKYFSKRKNHTRIHPILAFDESDIWDYINFFGVPYVDLYSKGYRSLGEKPFTKPAKPGEGERSGRDHDKEQVMKRLRSLGYW
ncbi:MAG TPA: sulfatase-like hydrolase/transferase [Patescibacteria group bacterium]|nr:sulfatase-like hydrolase/transferase [Patescibacteria group bacterium]